MQFALDLKQQAAAAADAGDLCRAEQLLTDALSATQEDARVAGPRLLATLLSNRAAIRLQLGGEHIPASIEDARAAIEQDAMWHKPYLRLAAALLAERQPRAALATLDQGIAAVKGSGNGDAPRPADTEGIIALQAAREDMAVAVQSQARQRTKRAALSAPVSHAGAPRAGGPPDLGTARAIERNTKPVKEGPGLITQCLDTLDAAVVARGGVPGPQGDDKRVAVTIISGFLGSGKTTLLQRIIAAAAAGDGEDGRGPEREQDQVEQERSSQGTGKKGGEPQSRLPPLAKFGILVNDLAAVGVDAALARNAVVRSSAQPALSANNPPPALPATGPSVPPASSGPYTGQLGGVVAVHAHDSTATLGRQVGRGGGDVAGTSWPANGAPAALPLYPPQPVQDTGPQHLVELSDGCICCGLRGDMLLEVAQLLGRAPHLTHLVIESTGVGQPHPIAAAFASTDTRGRSLLDYVRIDCLVTVVDASRFYSVWGSGDLPGATSHIAPPPTSGPPPASAHTQPPPTHTLDPEDCRPLAELLAEQVEYADVILLNKCDLLSPTRDQACAASHATAPAALQPDQQGLTHSDLRGEHAGGSDAPLDRVQAAVRALNPHAVIVRTTYTDCALSDVIDTHRFELERAQESAGWQAELIRATAPLRADPSHPASDTTTAHATASLVSNTTATEHHPSHRPETEVYGISSCVFTARAPFHPGRLAAWLHSGMADQGALHDRGDSAHTHSVQQAVPTALLPLPRVPPNLLRSKGFFWLASCPQVAWEWSTAGAGVSFTPYGEWLAGKVPRRLWPEPGARPGWDATWGDRHTALVFIWQGRADHEALQQGLSACVMTVADVWGEGATRLSSPPLLHSAIQAGGGTQQSMEEGAEYDDAWWPKDGCTGKK